ncbi:o-succinylbenzoate synthase [Alicyclobacillus sp.]|uniref:o-succinylbenzoate synthase n=1 Tax=Alicyclobacillus sp. TaxID=61169 RepID=UPI0025BDE7D3|nr:o-succinylbenzoate synthase [Alicyclobacillus sp.]MCL6517938.1 o-succinylbenzoate synthase [Alicyclobacillus sp.]
MQLESIVLRRVKMRMREPFETSFGREQDKDIVVVEARSQAGAVGFAECVAMSDPLYNEETADTAWIMIRKYFAPLVLRQKFESLDDVRGLVRVLSPYKGNRMAKAAVEMAVWDCWANETGRPLAALLGGAREEIPVGISVGIQPDIPALLRKIEGYVQQGFARVKVKVKPGWDVEPLAAIRREFPDLPLMADANSAYRLGDAEHLRRFDEFGLTMIEQPLAHDDILDHAVLQRQLNTAICLDESIHTAQDARKAIEAGACRVINIKVGRVGGFAEAIAIHDVARANGVPVWCGGMLETGIGRLHNVALTALPGFTLPGDTAPSARYFDEDVIHPPVEFLRPGVLAVEPLCGVASRVRRDRLDGWTDAVEEIGRD